MSEVFPYRKRMAAGMAALAITGLMAEAAQARPAAGRQPAGTEAVKGAETDPFAYKEKILKQLASGKLPNKILDVVISFSTKGQPAFYFEPAGNRPDTQIAASRDRQFFLGRDPRIIQKNGKSWLLFNDTLSREADPAVSSEQVTGVANDATYTYFMRTDQMPKDTRVFVSKKSGITGRVLAAHINPNEDIVAQGVKPGEAELLMHFNNQAPINNLIRGMGLVQTHRNLNSLR